MHIWVICSPLLTKNVVWWTGFKNYKEKYEPQYILHAFKEVFSQILKILTTIVRRKMKFIEFFSKIPKGNNQIDLKYKG